MPVRCLIATILFAALCHGADEKLLKPMAGEGSGAANGGLRACISMVKSDFGPGESLLAVFKLTNESNAPIDVVLNKGSWSALTFEFHRDGQKLEMARNIPPDRKTLITTIEPGSTLTNSIDLGALDWTDKGWFRPLGNYDVSITYTDKNVKTGTARFRITSPGEKRAVLAPEVAEKLRTLIAQLGDNQFAAREQAYRQILEIGMPALNVLDDVTMAGGDAEVVARCRKLIEDIRRANNRPLPPPPPVQPPPVIPMPRPRPIVPPPPPPEKPIPPNDEF